jgi:O6-methylguanine-DNA--protein-cysteine methyltransferase
MLRSIEKNFFKIVQRLGLLFAILSFIVVLVLGFISYQKISLEANDQTNTPMIYFSDYQNPISTQPKKTKQVLKTKEEAGFDQEFNTHVDTITSNLEKLPDTVIDKTDLKSKVRILVKIRSNPYAKNLQLAYVKSLAKLTKKMAIVGGNKTNVDEFLKWHDQEFSKQVNANKELNIQQFILVKLATLKIGEVIGYGMLAAAAVIFSIFIMFVMMLVMLRIERNTRQ